VEFIIHDFRTFSVQKSPNPELSTFQEHSQAQELSPAMDQPLPQDIPTENNLRDQHPIPPMENNDLLLQSDTQNSLFSNSFSSQPDPF
jgi:hypothetical protein